ncbi:hypothetical protein M432DRAFT_591141 [Thermoascus aurantiacus ATCC 26904]
MPFRSASKYIWLGVQRRLLAQLTILHASSGTANVRIFRHHLICNLAAMSIAVTKRLRIFTRPGTLFLESDTAGGTFFWKGTKSALSLVEDQVHNNNGNLKFIPAENLSSILAVWQSRTDKLVVGSLSVIESFDEGEQGMLEEVITSCLAVVLAERITGRGWLV